MVSRTSCAQEIGIDLLAERIERGPCLVGKRPRDARRLGARATLISNENFASAGSTVPVIGAAD